MSSAAPTDVGQESPAALRAMLRRRKSQPKLYWLLERPRPRLYVRAVRRVVIYRVIAAVVVSLAIALCAFLGGFVGSVSYPRWPAARIVNERMITLAVADALAHLIHWIPAFIVLGLIVVSIPRAHLWLFRITMLTGAALGYYGRRLPALPLAAIAADMTRKPAALLDRTSHVLRVSTDVQFSFGLAVALLAIAALLASILYRLAYVLTVRTTSFIPRRPIIHNRSVFFGVSLLRRLAAVPVTAGLLVLSLWLVQNIRAPLPDAPYGIFLLGHYESSVTFWIVASVLAALIICAPYPRGYKLLLIMLLTAITIYALWPRVHVLRLPAWIPAAPGGSFWMLVFAYFFVAGFGFDLIAALLDWPTDIPPYARRA